MMTTQAKQHKATEPHFSPVTKQLCIQPGDFIENKAQTQESTERETQGYITHSRVYFGVGFIFLESNLLTPSPTSYGCVAFVSKAQKAYAK